MLASLNFILQIIGYHEELFQTVWFWNPLHSENLIEDFKELSFMQVVSINICHIRNKHICSLLQPQLQAALSWFCACMVQGLPEIWAELIQNLRFKNSLFLALSYLCFSPHFQMAMVALGSTLWFLRQKSFYLWRLAALYDCGLPLGQTVNPENSFYISPFSAKGLLRLNT